MDFDWQKETESLIAWNKDHVPSLPKRRNFTFTLKQDAWSDLFAQNIVNFVDYYAYILHDKDETDNHYHFYVEYKNPRSFLTVANDLMVPVNQLQKVKSKSAILAYLTHSGQKDKYHYDKSLVVANFDFTSEKVDFSQLSRDFYLLKNGKMTPQEFLSVYESQISTSTFYNQLRILQLIYSAR